MSPQVVRMTVEEPAPQAVVSAVPAGDGIVGLRLEEAASEAVVSAVAAGDGVMMREVGVALRNTIKLALSLACTWSVALVVRFQLPRFLGPTEFGALSFADTFAGSFLAFLDLGVDVYIQKEVSARPRHASEFVGGIFALRTMLALALAAVMLGVLHLTDRPHEVQVAAALYAVGYLVASINGTFGALLQSSTRVGWLAIANVVAKFLWGAGLVACIWSRQPMIAFALPMVASEIVRSLLLFPSARAAVDLELRTDIVAAWRAIVASLPYFVAGVVIIITSKINIAVLEYIVTDKREVGWLGAASNIGSLAMIMSPLMPWIIVPMVARARQRSIDEVYAVVRFALEGLIVVAVPVALLIGVGADVWVRLAFGTKYVQSAMSLVAIAPQFVFTYTAMLLSIALVMLDQQWKATRNSIYALIMTPLFIVLIVPISSRLGEGGGAAGAALAGVFSEVVISSLCLYYVGRRAVGARTVAAATKSVAIAVAIVLLDRFLHRIGPVRIAVDMAVYVLLAFAVGAVRGHEVAVVLRSLWQRRQGAPAAPAAGSP